MIAADRIYKKKKNKFAVIAVEENKYYRSICLGNKDLLLYVL